MINLLKNATIQQSKKSIEKQKQIQKEIDDWCKDIIKDWDTPDWKNDNNYEFEWKQLAPSGMRMIWNTFSEEQKKVIAFTLHEAKQELESLYQATYRC